MEENFKIGIIGCGIIGNALIGLTITIKIAQYCVQTHQRDSMMI